MNQESNLEKIVRRIIKEESNTRSAKTRAWLKSFLNHSGIDYDLRQDSLILRDDMYEVELKILGGTFIGGD